MQSVVALANNSGSSSDSAAAAAAKKPTEAGVCARLDEALLNSCLSCAVAAFVRRRAVHATLACGLLFWACTVLACVLSHVHGFHAVLFNCALAGVTLSVACVALVEYAVVLHNAATCDMREQLCAARAIYGLLAALLFWALGDLLLGTYASWAFYDAAALALFLLVYTCRFMPGTVAPDDIYVRAAVIVYALAFAALVLAVHGLHGLAAAYATLHVGVQGLAMLTVVRLRGSLVNCFLHSAGAASAVLAAVFAAFGDVSGGSVYALVMLFVVAWLARLHALVLLCVGSFKYLHDLGKKPSSPHHTPHPAASSIP